MEQPSLPLYCQEYYEGINSPDVNMLGYRCDRCSCQPLTEYEYYNFVRFRDSQTFRYCPECWNWLHLLVWTDKDGNKRTLRSERRYTHTHDQAHRHMPS